MPQFHYRGRDKKGHLRTGQRFAFSVDNLNTELIKEGISPISIKLANMHRSFWDQVRDWMQGEGLHLEELAIFFRQMHLLQSANVPVLTSLKQLASHTRSHRLAYALQGCIEYLEKGESLATAMQQYSEIFSPLIINIVQIGESTGHLSESFEQLHHYLAFESANAKQMKTAFRYPKFVFISVIFAIIILNVFVIPTFAKFYANLEINLPWETRLLIGTSNFIIHYGIYLLILIIAAGFFIHRYLKTPSGRAHWDKLELHLPVIGTVVQRIILIRFSQSLAIILRSGVSITQALVLVKNIITNNYVINQITTMQEAIERGVSFTQAITKIDLFTPLEIQILAVGEKNGELSPALSYIANFHTHEIEFDLKRLNDFIGPILIGAVSGLILIVALGVYLPIWNMINLVHS